MKGKHLSMVALLAGLALAACGANPQTAAPAPTAAGGVADMEHGAMPTAMSGTSGMPMNTSAAPYDAQFIDSMIIHHQGAIDMAREAGQQAQKPELQTLAQNIITAQESEVAQLKQWRQEWYPDLPPTAGMGMDMGDMQISADTSTPFEQRFITAMIRHHQGAIAMARDAQQRAEHSEIKTLAQHIITAQEAEIQQMQQWQQAWYGN